MHLLPIILFSPFLRPVAYLDPGSGSFIIQLLIAAVVGIGFVIKVYWKKIKGLFNRSPSDKEDDSAIKQ